MNGVISGDTIIGTITTNETLTGQLSNAKSVDLSQDTITPNDLKSGVKAHNSTGTQITGEMPINEAIEKEISTKEEEYNIPEGYHNGNGVVKIDTEEQAKIIPENIKKDTTILGITGTLKGGYGYTKLGEKDIEVNTTSTAQTEQGTLECGTEAYTKDKIIYVRVRDKAGKRDGYFLGSDNFFINTRDANGETYDQEQAGRLIIRRTSYGTYSAYTRDNYGVYAYCITNTGQVKIYSRYNSSYSYTINGTYHIDVYALDYPDGVSPFDI